MPRDTLHQIARDLTNCILADLLTEYPAIQQCVDGLDRDEWAAWLRDQIEQTHGTLLRHFGGRKES